MVAKASRIEDIAKTSRSSSLLRDQVFLSFETKRRMLVSVSLWLGQGGDKIENGERMEHQMLTNRRDESIERRITKSEKK